MNLASRETASGPDQRSMRMDRAEAIRCFRSGPLSNVPARYHMRIVAWYDDAKGAAVALMMVLRDALAPIHLDDIARRRHCIAMRDAILPATASSQRAVLDRFGAGDAAPLADALAYLLDALAVHPQRESLQAFAHQLIGETSLMCEPHGPNPLVAALLGSLGFDVDALLANRRGSETAP
ncbi:hypothetical protein [Pandoraea terrae]|nr:hypothetical protein [Pandoraea terrae]